MQLGIDLTPGQTARVIEQALRAQAELDVEPRNLPDGQVLRGRLTGRESELLSIELLGDGLTTPPAALIGVFCELRALLSGEMYMFSTFVLDAPDGHDPPRVLVAAPETIQVANRRRLERTNATIASQVRVWVKGRESATVGLLANVSGEGLACNLPGLDLNEALALGDDVRVAFELAGFDELFELPAILCNKSIEKAENQLCLGLQFNVKDDDVTAKHALRRLQAALFELTSNLADMDGEI